MSHIFISYSSQDIEFVRYLRTLLESEGFAVWVDEARLTPGAGWWKDIEQNIERCAAFIVVMSPNAYESDWVEREILLAEHRKKPIYPVLLTGNAWSRMANIQYEDMRASLHARLSPLLVQGLRNAVGHQPMLKRRNIEFTIEEADVTTFDADVLGLKYAQEFFGVDWLVAGLLGKVGVPMENLAPQIDDYRFVETLGCIKSRHALFVGTPQEWKFLYKDIWELSSNTLRILAQIAPFTQHLAMTIHGVGFGLDEVEAVLSQFTGFSDAIQEGSFPSALTHITIVDINKQTVKRLRTAIAEKLANVPYVSPLERRWGYQISIPEILEGTAPDSTIIEPYNMKTSKPHAFVLMPPDQELDDVFYYGIQTPIHAFGLLCERIQEAKLTEDILDQARQRIESASVVVADLTGAHPAVCLQLGYAWGKERPTILLTKDGASVPFAVRDQPVLTYKRIKDAEENLTRALSHLKAEGLL
jgi:hypothetical protein